MLTECKIPLTTGPATGEAPLYNEDIRHIFLNISSLHFYSIPKLNNPYSVTVINGFTILLLQIFNHYQRERESGFLTAHQHKNRPFSAIRGKNTSKWDNQVNQWKYLTTFNVKSKRGQLVFIKGNNKIIIHDKNKFLL